MHVNRTYRNALHDKDLKSFRVVVKETDLFISVDLDSYSPELVKKVEKHIMTLRYDLEAYIASDPEFKTTLSLHVLAPGAPFIAQVMARAGNATGVGPMAAVAGTFAEFVGKELLKNCNEVIVENGGDIFMASIKRRLVSIFAGNSPFSNRLAVEIPAGQGPLGICTSSGTVGPSLSLGKVDAAMIIARSAALADAAASTAGNAVTGSGDVKKGIEAVKKIEGIMGVVVIKDDQLAVWGSFNVFPVGKG
jgi:ApbE superfamily uncharacterized protein (UPF0280 family)